VRQFKKMLDSMLDTILHSATEENFKRVGAGEQDLMDASAAPQKTQ